MKHKGSIEIFPLAIKMGHKFYYVDIDTTQLPSIAVYGLLWGSFLSPSITYLGFYKHYGLHAEREK